MGVHAVVLVVAAVIASAGCSSQRARVPRPDSPASTPSGCLPPVDEPVCPVGTESWITQSHRYCTLPDGRRHGPYVSYRDSGQLRSRGACSLGERIGVWVLYHENGCVSAEGTYVDGQKHGRWRSWFDDGTLSIDAEFERGHRSGVWSWADRVGLFKQGQYVRGARNGLWTLWHDNGNKAEECVFADGKESGVQLSWAPSGRLASVTVPAHGSICWDETGARIAQPCVALPLCTGQIADEFWIRW